MRSEHPRSDTISGRSSVFARAWPVDLLVVAGLLSLVTVVWCIAYAKYTPAAWALPTTYADPVYSDFLAASGVFKARSEGHLAPFVWKVNPHLAAPDVAGGNNSPTTDEVVTWAFGVLVGMFGLFSGFNVGVLIGHLAAALTFYAVARCWLRASPVWSFVGGLAFGLAPYLFAESPHHFNCLYAWHLPLFPVVWSWVSTDPGLQWRSRRFWQAVAIGLVTGLQNPYYTFIFCQLTLLGGAVLAWRQRSRAALISAAVVVAAAAAGFLISNLDTITFRMTRGAGDSPIVAERQYKWMDIYGFKVVDMFIPSFTHHSEALATFGLAHRQASVLNDEEGCAYLGMLGIACLLYLVGVGVRALLDGNLQKVPREAWWVLWIVLCFNTGGLNATFAAFTGFTLFRTACRYSIMILVIALLYAIRRLSTWSRDAADRHPSDVLHIGMITAAIAACLLVIWDQVPRGPTAERKAQIATLVRSDREFVKKMESVLPDKAMVFQFPVMDGTPLPGLPASDHFRPYLYSTTLHWSSSAEGKTLQWQQNVQKQLLEGATADQVAQRIRFQNANVRRAVDEMRDKGFAAIYINRNGFPDRGKGLLDALLELGYEKPPIYSAAGDLACVVLDESATGK